MVSAVGVHIDVRRCVIFERRWRAWLGSVALVIAGIVTVGLLESATDIPLGGLMIVSIILSVGIVLLVLRWLPWNLRVVLDMDDERCRVEERFFFVTFRRRELPLTGVRFRRGSARVPVDKVVDRGETHSGLGCLLGLFLGPIFGPLLTPRTRETVTEVQTLEGLLWTGPEPSPQLLLAVRDLDSVDDALLQIEQVVQGIR
ncbi:MAG: hypothetical protein KDC95_08830 [Planctomycetes bacterium]|nr:hypothetical protein [Planctomycetota bacterium]